jgi:hypothetical protein
MNQQEIIRHLQVSTIRLNRMFELESVPTVLLVHELLILQARCEDLLNTQDLKTCREQQRRIDEPT